MDIFFNIFIVALVSFISYFPIKMILVRSMPGSKSTHEKVKSARISTIILFFVFSFFTILEHFGYF